MDECFDMRRRADKFKCEQMSWQLERLDLHDRLQKGTYSLHIIMYRIKYSSDSLPVCPEQEFAVDDKVLHLEQNKCNVEIYKRLSHLSCFLS